MKEALIGVGSNKLRGGDFMIEVFEYFLSVLAVDPRVVVLVNNFGLLGFGSERAVTALSLLCFVHFNLISNFTII